MRRSLVAFALSLLACGSSGADSKLQCDCVRDSFEDGFLARTQPDGTSCTNAAIGGCQCLASECVNYCAFDVCQPECSSNADCGANEACNELVDIEFGTLGRFCEYEAPCPEGSTGCPCGPGGTCDPPIGDQLEAFCDSNNVCQVNDLCTSGCRQGSVCCGGGLCSGDCIGTPCC